MKENDIITLLRAYIINFPVMQDWGQLEPMPITLAFNNEMDASKFLKKLSGNPIIISESDGVPGMKKAILKKTPQSVFLKLSHCETEKEQGKLSILFALSSGEKIDEKNLCCPTFVIYTGVVPDIIRRNTLIINTVFEKTDYDDLGDFFSLVPEPEQLGQIRQKLIDLDGLSEGKHPLVSAVCFLYPKLHERGEGSRYAEVLTLAKTIEDGGLETPPIEDIVMLVTDLFLELAVKGCMDNAIELPNLEDSVVKALETTLFYDSKFLYLSNNYFREICEPILGVVSFCDIKSALREAGILQGSGSRYVRKMYYWKSYGVRSSANMLKFNMEKIVKDNPLSFYFKL